MSNRWTGGFIQAYFDPLSVGPAVPSDPGELYVVGNNSLGQLGINNVIAGSSPVQIDSSANWQEIASGQNYSLAVKSDGTLWSWGQNTQGQLALFGHGVKTALECWATIQAYREVRPSKSAH